MRLTKQLLLRCLLLAGIFASSTAAAPGRILAGVSDAGPDATISLILRDIRAAKLEDALVRTETLLKLYPNFRLAHLIRGDLLLARTTPLRGFGNESPRSEGKLSDLRDEAIMRIQGYASRPQASQIPRYLLQMPDDQKHALVVDTKRSRLYLYRNDKGRPEFVADFYITQGKDGANKTREGDKRTPVGVYHVTSFLPRAKLTDFYGAGAFPINYPNEWDHLNGRNGHGIWLHGVPADTYARPPKASDGCVVLANEDLLTLANYVQVGRTPVIISADVEWLSLDDWQTERQSLNQSLEAWRRDWESLDTERYLSHYASSFRSEHGNLKNWADQKRRVAAGKSWIKLGVRQLSLFRNPGQQEIVVVSFEQDYRSNNLNSTSQKRQYWLKEGGHWKIIYEGNA